MDNLISVVTTIYNCSRYLEVSIDSILKQTFPHFEFIIINDGSTDNCTEIVRKFHDQRIRYFHNTDNKRIPSRRNEAIRQYARTPIIAIHDGDDISLPTRLEKEYNFLVNNIAYFCVASHAIKINVMGEEQGIMAYPPAYHNDIVDAIVRKCKNPIIDPSSMFRKKEFLDLNGYTLDESIYTVPDFDLWTRAIISGKKLANIQESLIKYRVNPEGMTSKHGPEMKKAHMATWSRFMRNYIAKDGEKTLKQGKTNV